jgi:hypothetical protein
MPIEESTLTAPDQSFASRAGAAAKTVATSVAILYALGFAILCIHDSGYGIFEFDFLRARVFFVGFTFAVLFAIPAACMYYSLAYHGNLKSVLENSDRTVSHQRRIVVGDGFVYTAWILSVAVSFYLFSALPGASRPWWKWALISLAAVVLMIFVYSHIGKTFASHPTRAAVLAASVAAVFIGANYLSAYISRSATQMKMTNLMVFFFFVGWFALQAKGQTPSFRWALHFNTWLQVFVIILI